MLRFGRNDAVAVRRALAGDRNAFAQLVDRHDAAAVALAYARLRTRADAEDAAQEAWVQAYENLSTLREPERFGPWFAAIVRHCAARISTRRMREATHREQDAAPAVAYAPDPAARELRAHVRNAVEALDEPLREAVLLHYFAGQSSREIGAMLEVPAATIRKRLQRARERLGEQLLTDVAEEFCPSSARTKRIMGLVAASAPAWQSSRASAAVLAQPATGGGAVKAVVAGVVVTAALVGGGWLWLSTVDEPAQVLAQETPAADEVAAEEVADAPAAVAASEVVAVGAAGEPVEAVAEATPHTRTATLRGIVITSDGEPTPGADVHVVVKTDIFSDRTFEAWKEPLYERRLRTGDDGRFVAEGIPTGWGDTFLGLVDARHNGERRYMRMFSSTTPVWEYEWTISLKPTTGFTGKVLNEKGSPVAGAQISPTTHKPLSSGTDCDPWALPPVRTSADGRFMFDNLYLGQWSFFVTAPGYTPQETPFYEIPVDRAEVTLTQGHLLRGRLTVPHESSGDDPPHVVLAWGKNDYQERHRAEVQADGTFLFDSLRSGEYLVWVDHPRLILAESDERTKVIVGDNDAESYSELDAASGGAIHGRLFDAASGEALGDVRVSIRYEGGRVNHLYFGVPGAVTQKDGTFRIEGLPSGEFTLARRPAPHLPQPTYDDDAPVVAVKAGKISGPVDWAVDRRHRLSGRVTDADGQPVEGAKLLAYLDEPYRSRESFGDLTFPALNTDVDGRYLIYLPETTEVLHVQATREKALSALYGPISVDGNTRGPDLVLEPAGAIAGRVVGKNGRPAKHISVQLAGERAGTIARSVGSNISEDTYHLTDNFHVTEGYFYSGPLLADTYTIRTGHNTVTVELVSGEERLDLEVPQYSETTEMISGEVRFKGKPVPYASVFLSTGHTRTDENGRFTLPFQEPWMRISASYNYNVDDVEISRVIDDAVSPTLGEFLRLELGEGTGVIEGRVTRNGQPSRYVQIRLAYPNGQGYQERVHVYTNEDGRYIIDALPAGTYNMPERPWMGADGDHGTIAVTVREGETLTLDYAVEGVFFRPEILGLDEGETGRLRIVPGYEDFGESLDEAEVEAMNAAAVFRKDYTESDVYPGAFLEPGEYTAVLGAYPSDVASVAEALAELRLVTAQFEVVRSDEPLELVLRLP